LQISCTYGSFGSILHSINRSRSKEVWEERTPGDGVKKQTLSVGIRQSKVRMTQALPAEHVVDAVGTQVLEAPGVVATL
jgi:hypothetical protein